MPTSSKDESREKMTLRKPHPQGWGTVIEGSDWVKQNPIEVAGDEDTIKQINKSADIKTLIDIFQELGCIRGIPTGYKTAIAEGDNVFNMFYNE